MERAFKGIATAIIQNNTWSRLVKAQIPRGRIDLPSAPHNSEFRGPDLTFSKQTTESRETYNHFQMTADLLKLREWRELRRWREQRGESLPVVSTSEVRVEGSKEDMEAALGVAAKDVIR